MTGGGRSLERTLSRFCGPEWLCGLVWVRLPLRGTSAEATKQQAMATRQLATLGGQRWSAVSDGLHSSRAQWYCVWPPWRDSAGQLSWVGRSLKEIKQSGRYVMKASLEQGELRSMGPRWGTTASRRHISKPAVNDASNASPWLRTLGGC